MKTTSGLSAQVRLVFALGNVRTNTVLAMDDRVCVEWHFSYPIK